MRVVNLSRSSESAEKAIQHICTNDETFGGLVKKMSTTRAVQKMLKDGGFDVEKLHADGDMRTILNAFL